LSENWQCKVYCVKESLQKPFCETDGLIKLEDCAVNKKSPLSGFLTVILIGGLVLASAMRFGTVHAKPSVPEFTVKLVAHPYDVPPTTTTTIDQYTGKEIVTTTPGYHVENKSIEITINNQPFTPYTDAEGHLINLYYNVRFKGHFGQESDWKELYPYEPIRNGIFGTYHQNPPQSSSEYTVISFPAEYPDGALVDFQVQTMEGFYTEWWPFPGVPGMAWQFTGESSDWINTQTLTIGEGQTPTPSPTTTPTPTAPNMGPTSPPSHEPALTQEQLETIIGVAIAAAVIGAGLGLLIYLIKRK
jgi:hypothetical protein